MDYINHNIKYYLMASKIKIYSLVLSSLITAAVITVGINIFAFAQTSSQGNIHVDAEAKSL
jgi:hypothetical protein